MKKIVYIICGCTNFEDYVYKVGYIQRKDYKEVGNEFKEECKQIANGSVRIIGRCDSSEDLNFLNDILIREKKKYPDGIIPASYLKRVILSELQKRNIKIETSFPY